MDRDEKLKCLGDLLFDDVYINEKAVELQATNPGAFKQLVSTLIEEEDFSEERFYELFEELEEDKIDVLSEYQYFASRTLISKKNSDGCVFDAPKYEREIFGFEIDDDYNVGLDLQDSDFEVDDEELYLDDNRKEVKDEKQISTILDAYQRNQDSTCLMSVLEEITSNPYLIDYITLTHAQILGIDSLASSFSYNGSIDTNLKEMLGSIPLVYLTYSYYHNIQNDDLATLSENVYINIERFRFEEILNIPTKR